MTPHKSAEYKNTGIEFICPRIRSYNVTTVHLGDIRCQRPPAHPIRRPRAAAHTRHRPQFRYSCHTHPLSVTALLSLIRWRFFIMAGFKLTAVRNSSSNINFVTIYKTAENCCGSTNQYYLSVAFICQVVAVELFLFKIVINEDGACVSSLYAVFGGPL